MPRPRIDTKRIYDPPAKSDGRRILVDRVWPRGLRKEDVALDEWLKEVAPSTELRKWFGHSADRWDEFRKRYHAELEQNGEAVAKLVELCRKGHVTLLFGTREEAHNNAVALKEFLERKLR